MIRVLVVDDSAVMREVIARMLTREGDIEVVGAAGDPLEARQKIKALEPDVVTLDIQMPGMNGLAFLDRLMRLHPLPVVMVSTLTTKSASETLLALELGAVDFIGKPSIANGLEAFAPTLREKVRVAAGSRVANRDRSAPTTPLRTAAGPEGAVIGIGASTGGVDAVRVVLSDMPEDSPPILVAQHMPAGFTTRFAARLDEVSPLRVVEAADGMPLERGSAYVAPGDHHLRLERKSGAMVCRLGGDAAVSGHRPSVDVLFQSIATWAGPLGFGVILTGMGRDGARGLKAMRDAGAFTLGQTQASSLVYGMPRVAFEEGAVGEQVPVEQVSRRLASALGRLRAAA